jgi:hypothetical protein
MYSYDDSEVVIHPLPFRALPHLHTDFHLCCRKEPHNKRARRPSRALAAKEVVGGAYLFLEIDVSASDWLLYALFFQPLPTPSSLLPMTTAVHRHQKAALDVTDLIRWHAARCFGARQ